MQSKLKGGAMLYMYIYFVCSLTRVSTKPRYWGRPVCVGGWLVTTGYGSLVAIFFEKLESNGRFTGKKKEAEEERTWRNL